MGTGNDLPPIPVGIETGGGGGLAFKLGMYPPPPGEEVGVAIDVVADL